MPVASSMEDGVKPSRAPQGAHDEADLLTARPLHARLHGPPLACAAAGRACHSRFCAPPAAPAASARRPKLLQPPATRGLAPPSARARARGHARGARGARAREGSARRRARARKPRLLRLRTGAPSLGFGDGRGGLASGTGGGCALGDKVTEGYFSLFAISFNGSVRES